MKEKSRFLTWFKKQIGPRSRFKESDKELDAWIVKGLRAEAELNRRHAWDDKSIVALYAWNVKEDKK